MANISKGMQTGIGAVVLALMVPIIASVVAAVNADANLDATTKLAMGFVTTLFVILILWWLVQGFVSGGGRGRRA